jgi:hypothetical protein
LTYLLEISSYLSRNFDLITRNFELLTLLEWPKLWVTKSLDNIRYSRECGWTMEMGKRVPGQTIEVRLNLSNGMYTLVLIKHKAYFNLYVQAFFRRCIVSHLFEHIFSLIIFFSYLWIKRSYTFREGHLRKVSRSDQHRACWGLVNLLGWLYLLYICI